MATDKFVHMQPGLDSPADDCEAVVLGTSFTPGRGLYVGTGGDVVVVTIKGQAVTFSNVPSGAILPVRASEVRVTGTTASNIVAMR